MSEKNAKEIKQKHFRKMVAPTIIIAFVVIYALGWLAAIIFIQDIPFIAKMLGAMVFAGVIGVGVFVLTERIKEIESGEEDDISKY